MSLSEIEIDLIAERYRREMARYEDAAQLVEDRLRRILRAGAIRSLLSSRAKHPDDLTEKLRRKRREELAFLPEQRRYTYERLQEGLDQVVTDLAGCRVMVYSRQDEERVANLTRENFSLSPIAGSDERHRKGSGYRATHLLVRLGDDIDRASLRGATCEIQITTIAAHVFNELEHDIGYKDHGQPQGGLPAHLTDIRYASHVLDSLVERFDGARSELIRKQSTVLENAEQLRFALENAVGRPLRGDFARLHSLLSNALVQLTLPALEAYAPVADVLRRGDEHARRTGVTDLDDAVLFALGLMDDLWSEFEEHISHWKGPTASLKIKAAIQRVLEEDGT
jgi:ppGpp synthetase/RelA/SpoT-type nucleotidyltranferase